MKHFFLRKIVLYPIASLFITGLAGSILLLESGVISPPKMNDALVVDHSAPSVNSNSTITSSEEDQSLLINKDSVKPLIIENNLGVNAEEFIAGIDSELASLLSNKEFGKLRDRLLELASIAVSENDKKRLGYILNLLGQISIQELDLYSAEVYLNEALDIFNDSGDELGAAQVYLQLGRTHLKSRQIARIAGAAYDELQVGRWYLIHGLYDVAKNFIQRSIDKNMSINRFGSAASAHESLTRIHLRQNNYLIAEESAFVAARLFASSGKNTQARNVLKLLPETEEMQQKLVALENDIDTNFQEYRSAILQIERARDYRQLYRHYNNKGDDVRAWKFRLLANNSLAQVSKRALFHKQQGVLAILYNSNDAMDQAGDYFAQAKETFDYNGLLELSEETDNLNKQIY